MFNWKENGKTKLLIICGTRPEIIRLAAVMKRSREYLDTHDFKDMKIITLPDRYKDSDELPKDFYNKLLTICKEENIEKIIVSTEPKAHHMYLKFCLENNIDILCDKPIIVLKEMNKMKNINKMRDEYYELLRLYKKNDAQCKIMCQRLYHKGYIYIKELLKEVVSTYNIPITYIDIYHCDGNWEFPHDLDKENHPYKYGYGKLYHSGFHFIDLLSELLKINQYTTKDKRIVNGYLQGNIFTPNDELKVCNQNDYYKIFPESRDSKFYKKLNKMKFDNYGEKNFYSQLYFYNDTNNLITTANLNLLHYGVSRRGWFQSRDFYKKNGRIRHEKININVGTLLNIQITSCQSKEIKDRTNKIDEIYEGGLEHYDIDIYRNVDIIGGKPHEKIRLYDLYHEDMKSKEFIGFNEKSREDCITTFLNNNSIAGEINKESLGMEILYSASQIIYNKSRNIIKPIPIKIPKEVDKEYSIGKITDKDIGTKVKEFKNPDKRNAARGIIIRDDGRIALFHKTKKNEYKLPGGGIEKDEDNVLAFKREVLEETGCEVEIMNSLGIIKEEISHENFKQTSHIYVAKVIKDHKKLNLTKKEKEEGSKLVWVSLEKAIKLIKEGYENLAGDKYESTYHSKFIAKRDLKILEYYRKKVNDMSDDKNKWAGLYKNYINKEYENFDKYFKIKMKLKKPFLKQVMKYAGNKPILECGCGTGKCAVYLAQQGIKSYGMDLEEGMIKQTKELSKRLTKTNPVKPVLGNIKDIPYKDKYFSVTHSSGVMEHYSDKEIVQMINEQLRVSDVCVFSVPSKYFDKPMLGNERFMTKEEWLKIISKSKGEVIKTFGYHYKPFGKRVLDIIKHPKNIKKPIALLGFVIKEKEK